MKKNLIHEKCSYCGHGLEGNSHGVDQNDFNGEEYRGYCIYCKECRNQFQLNAFKESVIFLAKYLRKNFPLEVAENELKPIEQSGAVELAIELLDKYKVVRAENGTFCGMCCDTCKHGNCAEMCKKCENKRRLG